MDNDNVAIRLKGFIDSEELSYSQFADKCGIPRPSLSQILSGRNKKISDVIIGQIHRAFPALSVLWLLFGEGSMTSENNIGASYSGDDMSSENEKDVYDQADSVFTEEGHLDYASGVAFSDEDSNLASDSVRPGFKDGKFAGNCAVNVNFQNVKALADPQKALQQAENQLLEAKNKISELQMQIEKLRQNPRKVSHITVYYDDSTFETFYSQS